MNSTEKTPWYCLSECAIKELEEELLKEIQMKKKNFIEKALLKQHLENFYHIWQNKHGVYLTYVPDNDAPSRRKPLTASTKERLEEKIIAFYLEKGKEDRISKLTLRNIYPEWLHYKSLEVASSNYIRRIDSDWLKYYKDNPIIDIEIKSLTKIILKTWALETVKQYHLTKTQYYNLTLIIRQCLDYAVDNEWIEKNPFRLFKIDSKLFRKKRKPEDNTQVFLTDERPLIEQEAWNDYEKYQCSSYLAIPVAFQTGLRLGELVAIKQEDISQNGKYLHVQRMLQRQQERMPDGTWAPEQWIVVEHAKSDAGDRHIYLTQEIREILKKAIELNESKQEYDEGFIFLQDGKRVPYHTVNSRIKRYCDRINIKQKTSHKIRKSYISSLLDAGININEVRKLAGHEDEQTTLKCYCFNRKNEVENEFDLEKALSTS